MEAISGMEEAKKSESHLTSAAAFVEGGIQEACDDACSICLEAFCDSDPSTVTSCKHEFHLQCILEWCQRSSQCPMCWQSISLKDPTSQELLEAVERERSFRFNPSRNATIFHHPTLGDFELHNLPVGANDAELEERIIQHLAAAAAMGRARHIARREGHRNRSSAQGRPQFLVFSAHPNSPPAASAPVQRGEGENAHAIAVAAISSPHTTVGEEPSQLSSSVPRPQTDQISASASGSSVLAANQRGSDRYSFGATSLSNYFCSIIFHKCIFLSFILLFFVLYLHHFPFSRSSSQPLSSSQDRAGPSDFQSFSDSIKSRLNAVSTRYKESISKGTKGWRERLFSRNTSMADLGSEVKREVNVGIATVSRMMERLETRDNSRTGAASVSNCLENTSVAELENQHTPETSGDNCLRDANKQASCAAGSSST
ncbi:E3 ubiquitin-protein ligase RHF2A isoform X2 [Alnus glutinosa]|uniref:E3 ubiquitin-protein ligase RHF2A isoform X2 n=1 Tax=Alnus glutinosa TaxID=3517 RepID=UPI002D76A63E|nr:E3 ubiquitin-protein ligase RHF2A isoform X2 [Alnus glutinosa]